MLPELILPTFQSEPKLNIEAILWMDQLLPEDILGGVNWDLKKNEPDHWQYENTKSHNTINITTQKAIGFWPLRTDPSIEIQRTFDKTYDASISFNAKTGVLEFSKVTHKKMFYWPEVINAESEKKPILQLASAEVNFLWPRVNIHVPYLHNSHVSYYAGPNHAELTYAPNISDFSKPVMEFKALAGKYTLYKADETRRDFKQLRKAVSLATMLMLNGKYVQMFDDPLALPNNLFTHIAALVKGESLDSNSFSSLSNLSET